MNSESEIVDLIFEITRLIKSGQILAGKHEHLTLYQLQILKFIFENKKVRMVDIARQFHISKPTTTSLVEKLVKDGYLERYADKKDRRNINITLGKKGRDLLKRALKQRSKNISHLLSFVSDKNKRDLIRILKSISQQLKQNEK